ncbi:MAG: hypothetical protein UU46_C0041G0003 [Candidatus Uhrbacteria bacterium GW2011_GWD1_41_16]|uniref:Uncharacterized protein n=1 Tax=Candidatus Uhrbacteria bacterium GW2011_GWC1_41_20 TaxID=1618983 RepID=A0A0G0VDX8_9BACT|nr:MAG: hypothetical protein UT52_C0023G0002 [Candidatus Uhrbacteria bacterium GW2011_GWE1_39_46]KKR63380.1 MAG: hypothetical protein UU04_C0019G0013 [Candidatus Uhrbacteria bacterium GW2011_GWC2_40_450]KKR94050.1 MAG: hypothetical protein UU46_C0041G0003 [Candidatus Uhrbacteria bacterium GW2011_GWD1_41_16]KKR97866.1 MAG: hypothetical protein UU50_C0023G0012 [Candidatus Uhrbacteria bacterium GW2011_GWC1_41_20]KKS05572.1 MAG: hypothetical protein UU60_C0016G0002 [Candidatus Uhrbacteria bacterium
MGIIGNNTDLDALDPKMVQAAIRAPAETGQAFITWINAGCPVVEPIEIPRWRKISNTCIEVNLDAPLIPPFKGYKPVIWNQQSGWSRLELRDDGELYRNDTKVELFLTEEQKTGFVRGHVVQRKLEGRACLHPNELDALMKNTHLGPTSWKRDYEGCVLRIFFWAVGFRVSNGLCVRCLCCDGGSWGLSYRWLDNHWAGQAPAAVLAS